jgi:hypothetical protein
MICRHVRYNADLSGRTDLGTNSLRPLKHRGRERLAIRKLSNYSRLSIIRAWFNRFAAQPRQCIFKEKILFSVSITFV